MQLASQYDRIHTAGAEVVALSVDDDARNAGMARRWGFTHTRFVSDPGGHRYLERLGLFDPEERGGIALPAVLLLRPDGAVAYRYTGRDFADRTHEEELWTAIDTQDLPAVQPAPWEPPIEPPDDLEGHLSPAAFSSYIRGNYFGAIAIGGRLDDKAARAVAREHREMARSMMEAWREWRKKAGLR